VRSRLSSSCLALSRAAIAVTVLFMTRVDVCVRAARSSVRARTGEVSPACRRWTRRGTVATRRRQWRGGWWRASASPA
jgi:hypothetical protein